MAQPPHYETGPVRFRRGENPLVVTSGGRLTTAPRPFPVDAPLPESVRYRDPDTGETVLFTVRAPLPTCRPVMLAPGWVLSHDLAIGPSVPAYPPVVVMFVPSPSGLGRRVVALSPAEVVRHRIAGWVIPEIR